MKLDVFLKWINETNRRLQENKDYLSELDRKIGDGDHGVNIARGFQASVNKLAEQEPSDIGNLFQAVAMTLISKVGGASGPLYGTAFLRIATVLKEKQEISLEELGNAFKVGLEGLKQRGKADIGQKTMIDVWEPLITLWVTSEGINILDLQTACKEYMEKTKDLEAIKGRAAYLGKRSIGHLDPGAVSSFIIFDSLFNVIKGVEIK